MFQILKRLQISLAILVIAGLTIAAGVIHGRVSHRWGSTPTALVKAERLGEVPSKVGNWHVSATQDLDQRTLDMLQCIGHFVRVYANQDSSQAVSISIIFGPAGPTSVHTPEMCFDTTGQMPIEERKKVTIQDTTNVEHELWAVTFQANGVEGELTRVFYGWSEGDRWIAPRNPRVELSGINHIYKIQIATRIHGSEVNSDQEGFLRRFLATAANSIGSPD